MKTRSYIVMLILVPIGFIGLNFWVMNSQLHELPSPIHQETFISKQDNNAQTIPVQRSWSVLSPKKNQPNALVFLFDTNYRYHIYSVEQIEDYVTEEAPLDRIFGDTNEARLNLITCTGTYNRNIKEHEKRLVVYTKLIQ